MIDAKEAVQKALAIAREFFEQDKAENFGLEELEYDRVDQTWVVAVGFTRPWNKRDVGRLGVGLVSLIDSDSAGDPRRELKVIEIEAQSGELRSIRNYDPHAERES